MSFLFLNNQFSLKKLENLIEFLENAYKSYFFFICLLHVSKIAWILDFEMWSWFWKVWGLQSYLRKTKRNWWVYARSRSGIICHQLASWLQYLLVRANFCHIKLFGFNLALTRICHNWASSPVKKWHWDRRRLYLIGTERGMGVLSSSRSD